MNAKNLVKGTLIGTLVLFLYGATEWFNPYLHQVYKHPKSKEQVAQVLLDNMSENGIYIWPNRGEAEEKSEMGIIYFISKQDPSFYDPGKFMGGQLLINLMLWFLITALLLQAKIESHRQRVLFIMILGIIAGLSYLIPMWNWWGFSTEYVLMRWGNMLIGWLLAGIAVSWSLRSAFLPKLNLRTTLA
ncbi:MAG: hypothetical protein AAF696_31290 [Bacteroidota bacterium]